MDATTSWYTQYNISQKINIQDQSRLELSPSMTKYIGAARKVFPINPACSNTNLFECCCRKQFSMKYGSGFIGGAHGCIASMETFHLYQKFKDILKFISSENPSPISRGLARYFRDFL